MNMINDADLIIHNYNYEMYMQAFYKLESEYHHTGFNW